MLKYSLLVTLLCASLAACDRPAASPRPADSSAVVDSILPLDEEVRRFKLVHAAGTPRSLLAGAPSRAALVRDFMTAIERRDTTALHGMALDAGEFIELYYPASAYAQAPYRQNPAFVWFRIQQNSAKGLGRALARFGDMPAGYSGYGCSAEPLQQGAARIWRDCMVHWSLRPDSIRLFGSIIEHGGRFKFVSYANDL